MKEGKIKIWMEAFRLRTLPLALSCIGMGGFLAANNHVFRLDVLVLCMLTTIFLQVLSNLANDYGDTVNGADSKERKGPSRSVQMGKITMNQMKTAIVLFVVLCLASGVSLLYLTLGFNLSSFFFFLILGVLSILAAITYTMGKRPYGYAGLGDFSVVLFFGVVGVMGTYYLFAEEVNGLYLLPALSCGFFATAVLNVNNIRDIESDQLAGKFSIPVRIGRKNAIRYHWFLIGGGIFAALLFTVLTLQSYAQFLFLISVPLLVKNGMAVQSKAEPDELDPYLKQMALSTLIFVLTFGIGLLI